jgi:CBS-domain-containing membrane protein
MRVAELMHSPVTTVRMDSTIRDAVVTLVDEHISAVPVVDNKGRMVGVLSTTDLLEAESAATDRTARDQLFDDAIVKDLMTPRILTIPGDADVRDAAQQMLYAGVHRLFVEYDGKLVGVISQTDLVRAFATQRA